MKYIAILILFLIIPMQSHAFLFDGLPSKVKEALKDAHDTGNEYVLEAVVKYTKDTYPAYQDKIESYLTSLKDDKKQKIAATKKEKVKKKLSGNIDTNINLAQGNTKKQDLHVAAKLNYDTGKWTNTLKMLTRSSQENKIQTKEEYQANNQTKYNYTKDDYSFLELEYVNDRFGGYQYRNSELLGYGHKFFNSDNFLLAGEISAGARQSLLTDETKENSLLGKIGAKASWKINDNITLDQDVNSAFGSAAVITTWDTAIKTRIIESIYLKLNYNLQHIDDAPAGKNHIDTLTSLGMGYEF